MLPLCVLRGSCGRSGVTGTIPCQAPFNGLIHLGLSNTSIGGELPGCIVNVVHQLEISHTRFAGAFPKIESSASLRYLLAETDPESEYKFTGPMPSLEAAEHLHYANLNNHNVRPTPSATARHLLHPLWLAQVLQVWEAHVEVLCAV